jgi:hypothetical protein
MNQAISRLRSVSLRQIISVFLTVLAFLAIPAFSYSPALQAKAEVSQPADSATAANAKKVIDMAEDHVGDRPIGDTGLKNIRKLGENIPETAKKIFDQRFGNDEPADMGDPNVVKDSRREEHNNQG